MSWRLQKSAPILQKVPPIFLGKIEGSRFLRLPHAPANDFDRAGASLSRSSGLRLAGFLIRFGAESAILPIRFLHAGRVEASLSTLPERRAKETSMKRLVTERGPRALAFVLITFLPLAALSARQEARSTSDPSAPCPSPSIRIWAIPDGVEAAPPPESDDSPPPEADEVWTEFSIDGATWSRSEVPGWRYYRVRQRDADGKTSTIEERRVISPATSSQFPDGTILV
jgi:hypothetical protein